MIKAEFFDLGPHNGMGEFDNTGSYRAFTVYDEGQPGDIPQSLTFVVPAHQFPTNHAQAELQAAVAAEREACAKIVYQDAAFRGAYGKAVADRIRARTDPDAQAALEARDKRVWNEALKAALALSWLCFHKCNDEIDVVTTDDILALMEDTDDE